MILFLRRFLFGTMLMGLAAVPAFAQEDPVDSGDEADAIVSPELAPTARADVLEAYQVRDTDTEYMAGRLQVVDARTGEVRGVRKTGLLIVQGGKVVARAETGVSGVAQIERLPVGAYSVIAIGPDGIGAFGFEVLGLASGVAIPSYRFDTLVVPSVDVAAAQRSIQAVLPQHLPAAAPGIAPPAAPALVPVALQAPIRGDGVFGTGAASAPLKGQAIMLRDGESGIGQLLVLESASGHPVGMANARISFLQNGREVGTAQTDADGRCRITGMEDGFYSMVGVGTNGFIAMGIQVESVLGDTTADVAAPSDEYVSLLQPPPADFSAAGAPIDAMGYAPGFVTEETIVTEEIVPAGPYGAGMGGGGGGFGAGGGGGLGGGGLIGALVGAGVGAAIGAAVASDDDDDEDGGDIPPSSPNGP
ncbi:MAG: hypothetical protein WBC44_04105 [Planctomycetaceae bacterium]